MRERKKIELIAEILERYGEGTCFYCGSVLNGNMEAYDRDEGFDDDWCPNCCESVDPNDDWDEACINAIEKVIHDQEFVP
jgi:hypothetical protein